LIIVVVGFALSAIDPATQVSAAPLLVMLPLVAVMVELPGVKQVASPVALMDATPLFVAVQFTVGLVVLPNVSVPVAANCCVAPTGIDAAAGVTVMDASVAAPQFKVALPLMLPLAALTIEPPTPKHLATPLPLIVATPLLVLQLTEFNGCDGPEE
jgi:hypothetical protein